MMYAMCCTRILEFPEAKLKIKLDLAKVVKVKFGKCGRIFFCEDIALATSFALRKLVWTSWPWVSETKILHNSKIALFVFNGTQHNGTWLKIRFPAIGKTFVALTAGGDLPRQEWLPRCIWGISVQVHQRPEMKNSFSISKIRVHTTCSCLNTTFNHRNRDTIHWQRFLPFCLSQENGSNSFNRSTKGIGATAAIVIR